MDQPASFNATRRAPGGNVKTSDPPRDFPAPGKAAGGLAPGAAPFEGAGPFDRAALADYVALADYAALVSSRICHDLISPLGAIGNGLELLAMQQGDAGPEVALIAQSVHSANARIRFFRLAFGAATGGHAVAEAEIRSVIADLTGGGRLRVDWRAEPGASRAEVKLAFLAILCLESALPYGGRVTIGSAAGHWQITAEADRIKLDPALWSGLTGIGAGRPDRTAQGGEPRALTPAQVQFGLLPLEARRQGRLIGYEQTPAGLSLSF